MSTRPLIAPLRSRAVRRWVAVAATLAVITPVLVAACVTALVAQETGGCGTGGEPAGEPAAGGAVRAGLYAAPLTLKPGRSYLVGATEYGGPSDPSSGSYGSIPAPGEAYLPAHPDSFAELSVLTANPASHGTFTFTDANALGHLPYLTTLRVTHDGRQALLVKRDIGYGQGPGQHIENGEPYRLDVWWQAARRLGVSKSPVRIALVPAAGAANTLGQLATAGETVPGGEPVCPVQGGEAPLALLPGASTRILPSGLAAAGAEAPATVRAMVAAGNRLHSASYLYGGGHGSSLDTLQPAYDCSSSVSYLLHAAGRLGSSALDSSALARYGQPGPGHYVTVYANAGHAFMYVAGLRFDTVEDPAYDSGPNAGKPGPRWRLSPTVPVWSAWTVRHPAGL